MNTKKTEIVGCLYIYPSRLDNFDAEIVMWVTESEYNKGADPILFEEIKHWLKSDWPFEKVIFPGRTINWGDFFSLLDNQDQQYIVD